jgi:hypothetical protein
MAEFNPDAYLAGETDTGGFNPDAYLAEPIATKQSFLSKLGGYAEQAFKPQIQMAKDLTTAFPGTQTLTRTLLKPVSRGIESLQGAIASSPTAEVLASPFKTALSVGKGATDMFSEAGITPLDVLLPFVGKLKLALSAPDKVIRAAEVAKIQAQAGPKVFQEAVKKLAPQEAMTVSELAARTGTPEKAKAAIDFVTPSRFTNVNRTVRPMKQPIPQPTTKPFTLGSGLPESEQAALEAFKAKLPQGPGMAQNRAIPPVPAVRPAVQPVQPVTSLTPEQEVINALKEAKPLNAKQQAIYEAEKSKRAGSISAIGRQIPGEAGFKAQLSALKGEMPKVQFESVRPKLKQESIDGLFQKVEDSSLTPFEKISAKNALTQILGAEGGKVPVPSGVKLLSEVFSPEFVTATLEKRSAMEKLWAGTENILNLPRSIMSTLDLSMPLRQGAFLISRPKQWLPAFRDQFKYAWSENAYDGLMKNIQSRPTYGLMKDNGLAFTTIGKIGPREEAFASNLAEQIPVFGRFARASNRAATGFLNQTRADVFDDLVRRATETGAIKEPGVVKNIANFVNTASGRGGLNETLERASGLLNATFFSPKLMASRLSLLNPTYYAKLDPFTRKEALKSLFGFTSAAITTLGMAKAAGADVGLDPRSTDFMKIKIGNTRYDIGAGFQQYLVLAGRLLSGQMVSSTTGKEFELGEGYKATTRADIIQRFFESKTAPIASFALGLLKGKTTMGEPFDVPAEVIDRMVPMVTQDMLDLSREWGPKGVLMTIPGVFGVGSQTYGDQVPVKEITKTGSDKIRWKQKPGIGSIIANKARGIPDTNIPEPEQKTLLAEKKTSDFEKMAMDKIRKKVIETGEPQQYNGKMIYLEQGAVKTKDFMPDKVNEKAVISGVFSELRYLGIDYSPDYNKSKLLLDYVIKNPAYKYATKEQKKEVINKVLLTNGVQ